jgi:D-aspartate ligase
MKLSSSPTERIGAVVVGGDYQGLGIVRSLGRRGIPVSVIDDERSIARYSRYTRDATRVPDLRDEQRTVDALLDFARRRSLRGWVLFPTRDETVATFSRHKAELSEWYVVPTPDFSTIRWAWDKRNTYQLAQELGIPAPRTWYARDLAELDRLDVDFPLALKPAIKDHFIYATKAKAWRADSRDELRTLYQRAAALVDPAEIMIQELIPGDGRQQFAYGAFYKNKKAIGSMVVRRRRQHPPEFGRASTFVETVDLPILEDFSERFLQAIDYYGLVELEYKLDPRDKQYKLLDVNARTWGYHSLGPSAGVDFPYLLFADQLGHPVESSRAKVGVSWIRLLTDLPTGVAEIWGRRLDWRAYLRSIASCNTEAVFSPEDPLPGIAELILLPYLAVIRGY